MDLIKRLKAWWSGPEEPMEFPSRDARREWRKISTYVRKILSTGATIQVRLILVTHTGKLPISDVFLTLREAEEMQSMMAERGVACEVCPVLCLNLKAKPHVPIHTFGDG